MSQVAEKHTYLLDIDTAPKATNQRRPALRHLLRQGGLGLAVGAVVAGAAYLGYGSVTTSQSSAIPSVFSASLS